MFSACSPACRHFTASMLRILSPRASCASAAAETRALREMRMRRSLHPRLSASMPASPTRWCMLRSISASRGHRAATIARPASSSESHPPRRSDRNCRAHLAEETNATTPGAETALPRISSWRSAGHNLAMSASVASTAAPFRDRLSSSSAENLSPPPPSLSPSPSLLTPPPPSPLHIEKIFRTRQAGTKSTGAPRCSRRNPRHSRMHRATSPKSSPLLRLECDTHVELRLRDVRVRRASRSSAARAAGAQLEPLRLSSARRVGRVRCSRGWNTCLCRSRRWRQSARLSRTSVPCDAASSTVTFSSVTLVPSHTMVVSDSQIRERWGAANRAFRPSGLMSNTCTVRICS
mmetsp:Transcript_44438/g.71327  ORF Transcript_44438/g.71327 Transcript_44438/m.71327 type:complete len:349 (+) Transcript_44438:720-1766(+)